ncbi:FxsA family protein [Shewanella sp. GXUN23E]|uniref:FxsA family protein n=1 Tax=Shewanella sp. GXUN23E TaxID=3422498 RepID=UPI003D7D05F9
MFLFLFLIFVLVPVVELSVLIRVGEVLGTWTTIGLCLFTALVGASLVRSQGLSTLMQAQQKLARGESPGQEVIEGMMLAMAGIMLVIPGFVTDFIGLLLLTPFTRGPIARFILKRAQLRMVTPGQFNGMQGGFGPGAFNGQSPFGRDPFDRHDGNTFEGDFERKQDEDRGLKGEWQPGDERSRKDD